MRCLLRNQVMASLALMTLMSFEASAVEPLQLMLADTFVNYVPYGEQVFLWDGKDEFYATEEELIMWRVRPPYPEPVWRDYRAYFPVRALSGATVEFDTQSVTLNIELPPALFIPQRSTVSRSNAPEPTASTGFYFDYDVSYADDAGARSLSGLFAPTLFSPLGVLHTEAVYRHSHASGYAQASRDSWVRLDTNFTRDDPDRTLSYRAGDVLGAPGPWGSALRIGGVQIATNFGTQPSLVTQPLPSLEGLSATPSVVNLYVDGVLRHQENIESGNFRIDGVPSVTGAGEIKMTVTDILGREQVFYQDFYASSELLRTGLVEYSYSLGLMRENFGITSNDYGQAVFIGAHRQGINEYWTVGGRAELSSDVQLIGMTSDRTLNRGGVFSSGFGLSMSDHEIGGSTMLGYEYQTRRYRVAGRVTGSSREMATVDPYRNRIGEKLQVVLSAGMSRGLPGSLGASLVYQSYWGGHTRRVGTVNYSQQFTGGLFLSLFASYFRSVDDDYTLGLSFSKSFGRRHSANITTTQQSDDTRVRMEMRRSLPVESGVGYRLGATLGKQNELDGTLVGQTDYGRYSLDARHRDDETIWRVGALGSVAWLAGKSYLAREISRGFAVARVGGLPDVRVYLENHELGRTDEDGQILLPSLRPYETNRVRIEPDDLPLGVEVDSLMLEIAPYFRSGTVVSFPVRVSRQAILHAVQSSGSPIPEGAIVEVEGGRPQSSAGLNGMIYLKGLRSSSHINVMWDDQQCEFDIPLPGGEHPLPNLGEFRCETVL